MVEIEAIFKERLNDEMAMKIQKAIPSAAKRAASHAKVIGNKKARQIYTLKKISKAGRIIIKRESDGATLQVTGAKLYVGDYYQSRAKKGRGGGIFVSVKRGQGGLIARSFASERLGLPYKQRLTAKRFPLKTIKGPSLPQVYGNAEVMAEMEKAALEMYAKRMEHEISR